MEDRFRASRTHGVMIKYIGSKRALVPRIVEVVRSLPDVRTVCDLFTGTTRVARGLKAAGYRVTANDTATYAEVLALCYVEQDGDGVDRRRLGEKLRHLAALEPVDGYFTETFCRRSRYFQPRNGMRVDAIRPEIDRIAEGRHEWATLLVSLMEAADRVDSTTGLHMAYLKAWAPRSFNDLELRLPELLPGPGRALRADATELAPRLQGIDLCYLDPPYNQHSYFSNYHIWETLVRWDAPEVYGVACKRTDCRTRKSVFNSRPRAWDAFARMVRGIPSRYVVVSFSDEGYFAADQIVELLRERSPEVVCISSDFRRYVGAQIGIYNPSGERVGEVGRLRNKEHIFVAGEGAVDAIAALEAAGTRPGAPLG